MSESKYFFTGDLIKSNIEKIPRFEKGGICNDAICTKLDAFSQIDEIVKDIRDRQDNAMAMEFTKCIGELLKKNGVTPKITEYSGISQTDKTFETRYGVSIDELDFSEHDKVFEDKIAELEKQTERLMREKQLAYDRSEQLMKTADLLNSANQELKQRIAELESKESVKPMRIEFHADNGEMLTPLEVANSLINQKTFKVDELRELAEHLEVYCRHNRQRCDEPIVF